MTHIPTGFSAPTSEQNDVSMQNISSSSGSIHVHENDQKKHKLIMLKAPPALVARVTTPLEVRSPVQVQVSSGSEISVVSTAERQERYDIARLKRELAETRVEEAQAKLDQLAQEPALSPVLTTCAAKEETLAAPNGLPTWVLRYCKVCCPILRPLRLRPTPSSDFTL